MIPRIERVDDIAAHAAELFQETMLESVRERDTFAVALAGGTTPLPLYRRLAARADLPWDRARVFIGDERFVPADHADSNFGSIRSALLDHVPVDPDRVHPWPIQAEPEASADAYAAVLDQELAGAPFDLVLLGLGTDGHTAGIFPGTGTVHSHAATVASRPDGAEHPRLSMTPRRLSESRVAAFLVSGDDKRDALAGLLAEDGDREALPARAIAALERLVVITDLDVRAG